MNRYKRGDIWWIDLSNETESGHVQSGKRPCLIVSNEKNNEYSPTLTVVPLSSKVRPLPVHTTIYLHNTLSMIMCEQIRTVPKILVEAYYGYACEAVMQRVDRCLKIQMGLD